MFVCHHDCHNPTKNKIHKKQTTHSAEKYIKFNETKQKQLDTLIDNYKVKNSKLSEMNRKCAHQLKVSKSS